MPTSNQALILKKGVLTEDEVRPTSSGHRSGSQCSVPTVVSTLLLDPDCVYDATCHRACCMHAPRFRKESPQKPDAPSGIAARGAVDPQIDNIDWIAPSLHMRSDNIDRIAPSLHMHGDNIDRIAPSLHMRSDNIDRIAPSLHMRSDTPPSIPNAAVFSFRNNANVSQSKIKNG
ncbi:uncharacterized protein LOC127840473 [Dreissena polymorpha]|uniref:uncharacterized protein LOC127840473 n=1 Tax=Dreissena polymorpha TaxID=45954 RepID=UPI0022650BA0|nr:uncharacterized protein LOC127840473 [Dreissena polymorpha]